MQMLLLICIIRSGGVDADVFISAMLMNKSFLKGRQRKRGGGACGGQNWRLYVLVLPPLPFPLLVVVVFFYYFWGEGLQKTWR